MKTQPTRRPGIVLALGKEPGAGGFHEVAQPVRQDIRRGRRAALAA